MGAGFSSCASAGPILFGPLAQVPLLGLLCRRLVGLRVVLVVASLLLSRPHTGLIRGRITLSSKMSSETPRALGHCVSRQLVPGAVGLVAPPNVFVCTVHHCLALVFDLA